ncbi:MAG: hypothetical protein PHN37_02650 [Candidatus Pacebacteria bacterium]|nr:hypothetical protein [Candidatus Paceibacterota bacterium]
MEFLGKIVFLIGILTCLFAGIYYEEVNFTSFLFLLGIMVGFLNISEKERNCFLISVSALLLIGLAGFNFYHIQKELFTALSNILVFASGAVMIVAFKQILILGKD